MEPPVISGGDCRDDGGQKIKGALLGREARSQHQSRSWVIVLLSTPSMAGPKLAVIPRSASDEAIQF